MTGSEGGPAPARHQRLAEFFRTYVESVERYAAGVIPAELRLFVPRYLLGPHPVTIYETPDGSVGYHVKSQRIRKWSFRVMDFNGRIEEATGLPFSQGHCGFVLRDARHATLQRLALHFPLLRADNPFKGGAILAFQNHTGAVELIGSSDIRLVDVAVSYSIHHKPQLINPPLVWLFTGRAVEDLTSENARRWGEEEASEILLSAMISLEPNRASRASIEAMALAVNQTVGQFDTLTRRNDVVEAELQQFLESHPLLLDPTSSGRVPRLRFGDEYVSDFVLWYPDGRYRLVEIEPSREPILSGGNLSPRTLHALGQVRDWTSYIAGHPDHTLATRTSVEKHWVIIGRLNDLSREQRRLLDDFNRKSAEIAVMGFDQLPLAFEDWARTKIQSFTEELLRRTRAVEAARAKTR